MISDWGDPEPLPAIPASKRTFVVNAKTYTGSDMVMVDRTSEFGSPFKPDMYATHDKCIDRYKSYFLTRVRNEPAFRQRVLTLRGKTLGCWCLPHKRCHAQVIADWLDAQP